MRKLTAFLLVAVMSLIPAVELASADDQKASEVILNLDVAPHRFIKNSQLSVTLEYNGKSVTETADIQRDTKELQMQFDIGSYNPGDNIKITGNYGLCGLKYYSYYAPAGETFDINTYIGEDGVHNNIVSLTVDPLYYKDVDVFFNYKPLSFTEPAILCEDEYAFVPIIELAKYMGIEDAAYYPEYGCVRIAVGERELVYYLDSRRITVNGKEYTAACDTKFINSTIFAPLKDFCDTFESEIIFTDEGDKYNINVGDSAVLTAYNNYMFGKSYVVNEMGISSDTSYLIWVSKSEYTVRVFSGEKGNWQFITSFPCAIGAVGTPTCEGIFKYYQYQERWPYANYYCGSIMRFNGGYAIHSTLIKYNGVPYDNRVGMKISHGCVRLRPENINWLASTIPLKTTVYISP